MVDVTVGYSRYLLGPDLVGGPVEIAGISRHEGFKWVARKHTTPPLSIQGILTHMLFNSDQKESNSRTAPDTDESRIASGLVVMEDPYRRAESLRSLRSGLALSASNAPDEGA